MSRPTVSAAAQRRIDTVTDYVLDHHARTVDIATAAERASMAPAAFSRFFHRSTGRTFTDYVTEVRISSACALLGDSELPVTAIAERAGFRNLSNFNRQFRRHKGLTPTSYRTAKGRTAQHPPGVPKTRDFASR